MFKPIALDFFEFINLQPTLPFLPRHLSLSRTNACRRSQAPLPPIDRLREFLERSIEDRDITPVSKQLFAALQLEYESQYDNCTLDNVSTVFRIGKLEETAEGIVQVFTEAVRRPPPPLGSEASYHYFWDRNIRQPLELQATIESLVPDSKILEPRPDCIIEILGSNIKKTYTCDDAVQKIQHLRTIYNALIDDQVPITDSLVHIEESTVLLKPTGIDTPAGSRRQLKDCIVCVLQALIVAHRIPIYHRDIRQSNELASGKETSALPYFASATHSPDMFHDGHGPEVDIWGVGHLIKQATCILPQEIEDLGSQICRDSHILTAEKTLELAKQGSRAFRLYRNSGFVQSRMT
ncbi:hypothetical protein CPB83DRAFT_892527 [Crepidotus variabilis]|uniref:Protein kinase domain-containing protein n=1 Tax=Crepidotus variabilis TaxID=179855 RepID=A0A9P6JSA2_9AGAR|nr:hypothetical protein CPB83DRAFT_892527 [Crepidotus variabilis]